MNPIPAEMLKGISLNQSANIPPMVAMGIARKMMVARRHELKVKYKSMKMVKRAKGTTICNLSNAFLRFSY